MTTASAGPRIEDVRYQIEFHHWPKVLFFSPHGRMRLGFVYADMHAYDPLPVPVARSRFMPFAGHGPMRMRRLCRYLRHHWPDWRAFRRRDVIVLLMVCRDELIERGIIEG